MPPSKNPLILDASLKTQVDELKTELSKLAVELNQLVSKKRRAQREEANKVRLPHTIKVGDVVFIKDTRLPPPGVNWKLKTVLQKSPFVVSKAYSNLIEVHRVTDRFQTRVSPDDVVVYKPGDDKLFAQLPAEVRKEIGSTLTPENILRISESDDLPLLFTENIFLKAEKGNNPTTAEPPQAQPKEEDEEPEPEEIADSSPDKTVRFLPASEIDQD